MRARSYERRLLAASVSRVGAGAIEPTRADFEAMVYDLAFSSPVSPQACQRFSVLALHPTHAERLGRIRLRVNHGDVEAATCRLVECVTFGEWSAERVAALLDYESADERDDRRQAWARGEFPTRTQAVPVVYESEADAGRRARAGLQALAGWR